LVHTRNPVTILIAARNEEARIAETLRYLAAQDYERPMAIVLVDNGSTDCTAAIARSIADEIGCDLHIVSEAHPGKSFALNTGLTSVRTNLVITLDADTMLHPSAVRLLVGRLESSPADVCAVAGCVLVRNSRSSFWARIQEHDYFLGIASVKRMQGLFQGTLVAQGAFSLYRTDAVREVGEHPPVSRTLRLGGVSWQNTTTTTSCALGDEVAIRRSSGETPRRS
jgi:biofilm PGA synthesis N-glycosyltransferase PgaC